MYPKFIGRFVSTAFNVEDLSDFSPMAQCDITHFAVRYDDLVPYFEYGGSTLYNTGLLVHKDYVDKPNPAISTPPILIDPEPVKNARPIMTNPNSWY